jgi:hypothetical protein
VRGSSCCALRASGQQPASAPPFSTRCRAVGFDMCGVDHLRVRGSSIPGKLPEQVLPDASPCPAHKAVIDRRRRTISFRAIAPAAAALEHVYDPADHAPVVCSLDAAHIRRQMRFNPCPLLVVQPEQISAHQFFPNTNQYRIVQTEKLMSSDPRTCRLDKSRTISTGRATTIWTACDYSFSRNAWRYGLVPSDRLARRAS